jgi:Mrr N-terminal domain
MVIATKIVRVGVLMSRQLPPVDDEVFQALQGLAEPLVDDANSVLRRLLGLAEALPSPAMNVSGMVQARGGPSPAREDVTKGQPRPRSVKASTAKARRPKNVRAARGTLLPERDYEEPLLSALNSRGGSAPASEVIEDVGVALADRLTEADQEVLDSGLTRWKNRVQFVRLKLVQAGHMKKDSPRGVWEITPAGRDRLTSGDGSE